MHTLRVANRSDFPAMMRVRAVVRENRLSDLGRIGLAEYADVLERGGRAWVAVLGGEEGRVVGFAAADLPRRNVWALFVEPACEGRGIGRALHDVMMAWFFERGSETVWLSTEPGTRAASFYRAVGWADAGPAEHGEVRFEMTLEAWRRSRPGPSPGSSVDVMPDAAPPTDRSTP